MFLIYHKAEEKYFLDIDKDFASSMQNAHKFSFEQKESIVNLDPNLKSIEVLK